MNVVNNVFLKLAKRAETYDKDHLVNTFVDVGPLFTILKNQDHEILYGRRGTGKTHALSYLSNDLTKRGDIVINIDLRTVGSNGGIFSDPNIPITERSTRLLIDTLTYIHDGILQIIFDDNEERLDLSILGPILDNLADAISEIRVIGSMETESTTTNNEGNLNEFATSISISEKGLGLNLGGKDQTSNSSQEIKRVKRSGTELHRVHFSSVFTFLSKLSKELKDIHIWIIFDEWSEIPIELQPYLAELLRRTILPNRGITIKIAAIDQRTKLTLRNSDHSYIGIEIGADIAASQNLDEYMVFDNDESQSKEFFGTLIYKHFINLADEEIAIKSAITNKEDLINTAFTQKSAFTEFVRAAEGVPRDAINILSIAAMRAKDSKISVEDIHNAARLWYNRGKEKAIASNEQALLLLRWIIDEVIAQRNARAFLIKSNVRDSLIDYLFDARILHIIKENIAAKDQPGIRYNVYSIDYGCYVELINTTRAPKGLFEVEDEEGNSVYVEVPHTDYRSIRRAILNLDEFYSQL